MHTHTVPWCPDHWPLARPTSWGQTGRGGGLSLACGRHCEGRLAVDEDWLDVSVWDSFKGRQYRRGLAWPPSIWPSGLWPWQCLLGCWIFDLCCALELAQLSCQFPASPRRRPPPGRHHRQHCRKPRQWQWARTMRMTCPSIQFLTHLAPLTHSVRPFLTLRAGCGCTRTSCFVTVVLLCTL